MLINFVPRAISDKYQSRGAIYKVDALFSLLPDWSWLFQPFILTNAKKNTSVFDWKQLLYTEIEPRPGEFFCLRFARFGRLGCSWYKQYYDTRNVAKICGTGKDILHIGCGNSW